MLGQRRRRGGDHRASRHVGQTFQDDGGRERSLVPPTGDVFAAVTPRPPPALGVLHHRNRVGRAFARFVRRMPRELERDGVTFAHRELGDGREVLAVNLDRSTQSQAVRPPDGAPLAVDLAYPRNDEPVVEADDELHLHRDPTSPSLDQADDVELIVSRRHAVDDRDLAVIGGVDGLEDQRAGAVPAFDTTRRSRRCEQPPAVSRCPEQTGEARRGVEARERQPVDRSVASDQRRRLQIGQERVVGDRTGHGPADSYTFIAAGIVYSAATRGGSRRASAASIAGPRRWSFALSMSSAVSANSGSTSFPNNSSDSQMCSCWLRPD